MAAITALHDATPKPGGLLHRYYGTSGANSSDTLTSEVAPKGGAQRVVYAACHYSGSPTQAGVTFSIDSGLGASFDLLLHTGSQDAQNSVYSPDEEIWLLPGDAFVVSAPAGGGSLTSSIVIVLEQV